MTSIKRSPFDFVKSIRSKEEYLEDITGFSSYIVTSALSADAKNIHAINAINNSGGSKLSSRAVYDYYFYLLKKDPKFLKFPKTIKELNTIKYLMTYFQVNERIAKQYIELLSIEEIDEIRSYYEDVGVK